MRVFHQEEPDFARDAAAFAIGAVGGLAIGVALSMRPAPRRVAELGSDLRDRVRSASDRARSAARRLQPARLRRMAGEQAELMQLEDRVLDVFLADGVLSERGIDVGAISEGIIELSGSVWSEGEADHAVAVANAIPGVRTVVNRMDIESAARRRGREARAQTGDGARWSGRGVGMDPRRQGRETDPGRPDDSQPQREGALEDADRLEWQEEGLAAANPRLGESAEVQDAGGTGYDEDELDHQDPHGKHAARTLDQQPQALNASSRVGEGLKSGTHLRLEQADVPAKPHAGMNAADDKRNDRDRE